jgi:hypothetical protein
MRQDMILKVFDFERSTEITYPIAQRNWDETTEFNVWKMQNPGYALIKRVIDGYNFIYQSIWVECRYRDPDSNEILFKLIGSNEMETDSTFSVSLIDDQGNLVLPEFRFSVKDFRLGEIFKLKKPIIELLNIVTRAGKEYNLGLWIG